MKYGPGSYNLDLIWKLVFRNVFLSVMLLVGGKITRNRISVTLTRVIISCILKECMIC